MGLWLSECERRVAFPSAFAAVVVKGCRGAACLCLQILCRGLLADKFMRQGVSDLKGFLTGRAAIKTRKRVERTVSAAGIA